MDDILRHLAQVAAVLLFLEFFVLLFIFLAISGGLAFGLRWGRGKLHPLFEKVNDYLVIGGRYVHTGTDYAAKPFIAGTGALETVRVTAQSIRERVRRTRTAPERSAEPAEESTEPVNTLV